MVATIEGGGMRNAWDGPTILQVRRGERGGARSLLPRALRHALFSLPRFALSAAHQRTPPSPYTSHPRKHQSFLTIVEVIMVCAFGAVLAHVVSLRRKTEREGVPAARALGLYGSAPFPRPATRVAQPTCCAMQWVGRRNTQAQSWVCEKDRWAGGGGSVRAPWREAAIFPSSHCPRWTRQFG